MIHFLRPYWLLLFPLILWLGGKLQAVKDPARGWRVQMDAGLMSALMSGNQKQIYRNLRVPVILGIMLLVLSGPVFRKIPSPFTEDAAPLIVLLNCATSMGETPPEPSALLNAQLKIQDLADVRKGGKLGLIAYAGSAHLVLPPTKDAGVVAELAGALSPEMMPVPGDDLSAALTLAGSLLTGENAGGSLLVITDRVEASAADVERAWQEAGKPPVQFLSMLPEEGSGISLVASKISAEIVQVQPDQSDMQAVSKNAARQVRMSDLEDGEQWAEDSWWLLWPIAGLLLWGFRKEEAV